MSSTDGAAGLKGADEVLLISCYELGHQPLSLASPLAHLQRAGYQPGAVDTAVEDLDDEHLARARFVGVAVPMHTALRLGVQVAARVRAVNPDCHIAFYGLYAALNSTYLLESGVDSCIGGEYEAPLLRLVDAVAAGSDLDLSSVIRRGHDAAPSLQRPDLAVPARDQLRSLDEYSQLEHQGELRTAGYTEASRGCLHLCTHCPIPPVYEGRFVAVPVEVVVQDVAQQVAAGARHITFGDPDFLNGPTHALRVVQAVHEAFPQLTFDFTAKIQHLIERGDSLPEFADAGCLFIISAVESLSDRVLSILQKRHSRADVDLALARCRQAGIAMRPTWVTFTPWTELADLLEILDFIESNDLIGHVDPIQYAVRLLIPPGSLLADLPETRAHVLDLDEAGFTYRWHHPDPRMDELQQAIASLVASDLEQGEDPARTFYRICDLARGDRSASRRAADRPPPSPSPRMTEPWFC